MKLVSSIPGAGEVIPSFTPETEAGSERKVKVYFEADFWKLDFPLEVALKDPEVQSWLSLDPEQRANNFYPPNRVRDILSFLVLKHASCNNYSTGRTGLRTDELVDTLPIVAPEVVQALHLLPRHFGLELGRLNGSSIGIAGSSVLLTDAGRKRLEALEKSFQPKRKQASQTLGRLSTGSAS